MTADNSQYTDSAHRNNPEQTETWQHVGGVSRRLITRPIQYCEWASAPCDEEGAPRAWAACRVCDAPIRVSTWWQGGEVVAISTGGAPGCQHEKCGDKFPATIIRMCREGE